MKKTKLIISIAFAIIIVIIGVFTIKKIFFDKPILTDEEIAQLNIQKIIDNVDKFEENGYEVINDGDWLRIYKDFKDSDGYCKVRIDINISNISEDNEQYSYSDGKSLMKINGTKSYHSKFFIYNNVVDIYFSEDTQNFKSTNLQDEYDKVISISNS